MNFLTLLRINTSRVPHIDIAKAFGMLLIIWGHIRLDGMTHSFVYSFHIPLFFFLSGIFFNRSNYHDFKLFVRKRIDSLLIPYVCYSFFFWLIWVGFSSITNTIENPWSPLLQTLLAQGSDNFLVHDVPLWFVPCLFVMELQYYMISRFNDRVALSLSAVLCVISHCLLKYCSAFDFSLMPWSLDVAMLGIPFFALGSIFAKKVSFQRQNEYVCNNKLRCIIFVFILFFLQFIISGINGDISFGHAYLGRYVFLTYMGGVSGIIMLLLISLLFTNTIMVRMDNGLNHFLLWLGQNSFAAMAIHCPVKGGVSVCLAKIFHSSSYLISCDNFLSCICFIITLFFTIIAIVILNLIISRIRLSQMR